MMSEKRVMILRILRHRTFDTATDGQYYFNWKYKMPQGTFWYNLKSLRKEKLVVYGKPNNVIPLQITAKGIKALKEI